MLYCVLPCASRSPTCVAGGVSVLDVDTREDVVQRERREVCLPCGDKELKLHACWLLNAYHSRCY